MDLSLRHLDTLVHLLFGGVFAIWAVHVFVKHRSILGMVVCLLGAVVFTAVGLLNLLGVVAPAWVDVPKNAVLGIVFLMIAIDKLSVMHKPGSIRWLFWVAGVVCILEAVSRGLAAYYWP